MNLSDLGWQQIPHDPTTDSIPKDLIIGRVLNNTGRHYIVITENGEQKAILPRSFLNHTVKSELPTVGDWIRIQKDPELAIYIIRHIFPRKNKLSRKVPGKKTEEQIIASNIDSVFIVTTVDDDFNVRRLERYLTMVYDIDAEPVIILNKIDKTTDISHFIRQTQQIDQQVPIIPISATKGFNIHDLKQYIDTGKTIVLVGSSGVGKSTIINTLLGYSRQRVGETRPSDDKGKHVTTARELIILPTGGMIIDNPGIRELQLWNSDEGISRVFHDIAELASMCKFKDCHHDHEPGCAVKKAIEQGTITKERFQSYKKLLRENEYLSHRKNIYEKRKKDKQRGKLYKSISDIHRLKGKR